MDQKLPQKFKIGDYIIVNDNFDCSDAFDSEYIQNNIGRISFIDHGYCLIFYKKKIYVEVRGVGFNYASVNPGVWKNHYIWLDVEYLEKPRIQDWIKRRLENAGKIKNR